jgi:hypothetical protein
MACAALLGVLAAAAPAAAAPQEDPEEEKFYRAEDPDAVPDPTDLHSHTFLFNTRFFQGMAGDADLKADGPAAGINLQWLWSPFDPGFPVRFEAGLELGWIDVHEYDSGGHTAQSVQEISIDLEPGFDQLGNYPASTVISEAEVIYGGALARVDFLGRSAFDLGLSLGIWGGSVAIESVWFCTDCNGTGPSNDAGDADLGTLIVRFGSFFGWQYEWFVFGIEAGATYFQRNKLPMRFGVDFGFTLGVGF